MAGMSSRAVADTVVYAQDVEPSDTRDGVLWVDTSEPSRPVYVYSSDTGQFEPTAPGNVTVSDTAPTGKAEGHLWVDTSAAPPTVKTLDGAGNWTVLVFTAAGYVDETANRAGATTYQNSTGAPLVVQIYDSLRTSNAYTLRLQVGDTATTLMTVDGSSRGDSGSTNDTTDFGVSAIVPDGHYYELTAGSFDTWAEQTLQVGRSA